jgi:uncharacterized protein YqgC (DUF456 family)
MELKMKKENNKANGITSLVTGLIGVLFFLLPIFGIIMGSVSIAEARKEMVKKKPRFMGAATTGIVLAILAILGNIVPTLIYLAYLIGSL